MAGFIFLALAMHVQCGSSLRTPWRAAARCCLTVYHQIQAMTKPATARIGMIAARRTSRQLGFHIEQGILCITLV